MANLKRRETRAKKTGTLKIELSESSLTPAVETPVQSTTSTKHAVYVSCMAKYNNKNQTLMICKKASAQL